MSLPKRLALAMFTYIIVGFAAAMPVHALSPGDFDPQGRLLGGSAALFGLAVQALSCFLAGGVAGAGPAAGLRATMAVAGGLLLAFNAVLAAAFWDAAPAWYNWSTLAMALPFAVLGVAWKASFAPRPQVSERA